MRKCFIIILLGIFTHSLWSSNILQTETKPNRKLERFQTLALYKFDGKLINRGRTDIINYLKIADQFHKYLLEEFQQIPHIKATDAAEKKTLKDNDSRKVLRSKDVPSYNSREMGQEKEYSEDVVKTIDVALHGKITKFYEGDDLETSYIEVVFYLVDTKTKVVYWTTRMKGCLKFVAESMVKTLATGEYWEPTTKDTKDFQWKDPSQMQVRDIAFEYRRGYFIPPSDKLDSGGNHILALYLKLPFFLNLDLYNQIELNIIPSLRSTDNDNPLRDYEYTTYLPLFFHFIYNFTRLIKTEYLRPFVKAGLGGYFQSTYYSGTGTYIENDNRINGVLCLGTGIEYSRYIGNFNIFGLTMKLKKLGVVGGIDYYKWFSNFPASGGFNLSLGLKYYL